MDRSIYYSPLVYTYQNRWKFDCCTLYCVQYLSTVGISYKLFLYMPLCLVIRLILLSSLLLHCRLSNACSAFHHGRFYSIYGHAEFLKQSNFFRLFGLTKIPPFIFQPSISLFFSKKKLIEGPVSLIVTFKIEREKKGREKNGKHACVSSLQLELG